MDSCSCSPLIYTRWSSPFYFALLRVSIESCEFLNAKSLSQFQQGLYPRGEVFDFFTGDLEAGVVAAADVGPVQLAEIVLMLLSVLREYRFVDWSVGGGHASQDVQKVFVGAVERVNQQDSLVGGFGSLVEIERSSTEIVALPCKFIVRIELSRTFVSDIKVFPSKTLTRFHSKFIRFGQLTSP